MENHFYQYEGLCFPCGTCPKRKEHKTDTHCDGHEGRGDVYQPPSPHPRDEDKNRSRTDGGNNGKEQKKDHEAHQQEKKQKEAEDELKKVKQMLEEYEKEKSSKLRRTASVCVSLDLSSDENEHAEDDCISTPGSPQSSEPTELMDDSDGHGHAEEGEGEGSYDKTESAEVPSPTFECTFSERIRFVKRHGPSQKADPHLPEGSTPLKRQRRIRFEEFLSLHTTHGVHVYVSINLYFAKQSKVLIGHWTYINQMNSTCFTASGYSRMRPTLRASWTYEKET